MTFAVGAPYPTFNDRKGNPLDVGLLYIGVANQNPQTNPITVYWDSAATIPAAQPLRISGGYIFRNGTPANVFADAVCSITVRDANSALVYSAPLFNPFEADPIDQWIESGLAPVFVSTTSFTLVGDQTTAFHVGRRVKTTNSGSTIFSTIVTSAFTTVTTVTVENDALVLDAGLSAVSYSILTAVDPSLPRGVISPSQLTGNTDDWTPTNLGSANAIRFSTDARRNITGLGGGQHGRSIALHNVGTFPATVKYEDSNSIAANRFAFGITLGGGQSMELQYDKTSARWRMKAAPPDPVGALRDFGGGTVPEGYLACDGSNVSRATYAPLFNEVGTTWGVGDGSTTFGTPDFRRRTAVGSGGTGTGTLGNAVGNVGGAETHTLLAVEIPNLTAAGGGAHGHSLEVDTADSAGSGFLSTSGGAGVFTESGSSDASHALSVVAVGNHTHPVNSGGGGAHNIMQASAVVTKIIKF